MKSLLISAIGLKARGSRQQAEIGLVDRAETGAEGEFCLASGRIDLVRQFRFLEEHGRSDSALIVDEKAFRNRTFEFVEKILRRHNFAKGIDYGANREIFFLDFVKTGATCPVTSPSCVVFDCQCQFALDIPASITFIFLLAAD